MVALGKQLVRGVSLSVGLSVGLALLTGPAAFAQAVHIEDPNAPPPIIPPPPQAPTPPPPAVPSHQSGGQTINGNGNNSNANNVNPTVTQNPTITANPTNNNSNTSTNTNNNEAKVDSTIDNKVDNKNDNKNDNRSSATNNNTIYIYPPAYPPPAPPIIPPPVASSIAPPPLVPPPAYSQRYSPQRVRLNCAQLCARPRMPMLIPAPPVRREHIRYISFGGHVTALGMAHQPVTGWGTLFGGGVHMTIRSRGHFGFEIAQDFLRGTFSDNDGYKVNRQSYPVDFTFRGYILPNLDRYHFNMYFGGGFGAMASNVSLVTPNGSSGSQSFLEYSIHADAGMELRFKCVAFGVDGKFMGIARDNNFADGRFYRGISNGIVPSSTYGVQGRGYLSFWF